MYINKKHNNAVKFAPALRPYAGPPLRYGPLPQTLYSFMKTCPKCNGQLIGIDTLGFFAFDKKAIRYYFVGLFAFFIWFWSNLVYVLAPKEIVVFILVVYYIIGLLSLVKFYAYYANKVIYECTACKNRFMGNSTEIFSYKEWSKNEYNKSFKKDAQ